MKLYIYVALFLALLSFSIGEQAHVNEGKRACIAKGGFPVVQVNIFAWNDVLCATGFKQ